MLRITVHDEPGSVTFQLEGKLAGSWVQELQDCWRATLAAQPNPAVRFDLTEVTFVDSAGKALLAEMRAQGAEMITAGCLMTAIVAEICRNANSGGVC